MTNNTLSGHCNTVYCIMGDFTKTNLVNYQRYTCTLCSYFDILITRSSYLNFRRSLLRMPDGGTMYAEMNQRPTNDSTHFLALLYRSQWPRFHPSVLGAHIGSQDTYHRRAAWLIGRCGAIHIYPISGMRQLNSFVAATALAGMIVTLNSQDLSRATFVIY